MADAEKTLEEKTNEILQALPENTSAETKVLIQLVRLLLSEYGKHDIAALQGLVAVQKNVTDNLVKENDRLKTQTEKLTERLTELEKQVDSNEQHDRNRNLVLVGVPEGGRNENTTQLFVDNLIAICRPSTNFRSTTSLAVTDSERLDETLRSVDQSSPDFRGKLRN